MELYDFIDSVTLRTKRLCFTLFQKEKKAVAQLRRLGPEKIRRAIELLGETDLDLRGKSALDGDILMEVLVARLAHLTR